MSELQSYSNKLVAAMTRHVLAEILIKLYAIPTQFCKAGYSVVINTRDKLQFIQQCCVSPLYHWAWEIY